jgi:hypothetical protein
MDVATICVGVWAGAQSILAAEFGSLCDSQGTMVWGIFKGCHVTYGFVCHGIGCFHEHHCLDADDNTRAPVFTELSEEGSQLVDVGKWLVCDFFDTSEKIVKSHCIRLEGDLGVRSELL